MTPPEPRPIVLDVGGLPATAAAIDQLARLGLSARRNCAVVVLRNLSPELAELIDFAGLRDALRVEVERQPEEGEERGGVEEKGELEDPSA